MPGWDELVHLWACPYPTGVVVISRNKMNELKKVKKKKVGDFQDFKVTARMLEDKDWLDKVYFPANLHRF